jgi:hypothetical protein
MGDMMRRDKQPRKDLERCRAGVVHLQSSSGVWKGGGVTFGGGGGCGVCVTQLIMKYRAVRPSVSSLCVCVRAGGGGGGTRKHRKQRGQVTTDRWYGVYVHAGGWQGQVHQANRAGHDNSL